MPLSIWNDLGRLGNDLNPDSPWNELSMTPPAVVDGEGNFYGYFTTNTLNPKRTKIAAFVALLNAVEKGMKLDRARRAFCE